MRLALRRCGADKSSSAQVKVALLLPRGVDKIRSTPLMGMDLDRINSEKLDSLALAGSPAYVNQALRILRRLLGKAAE
jgi:hypothetical protein